MSTKPASLCSGLRPLCEARIEFIRALPSTVGNWLCSNPVNGLTRAAQPEHLLVWPLIAPPQQSHNSPIPRRLIRTLFEANRNHHRLTLSGSEFKTPYLPLDAMSCFCPRDGSALVSPEDSDRSTFSRHGIHHCDECSGMLLNADAAMSTISQDKLSQMHESFEQDGGAEVDIDCPLCDSHMRVRDIVFTRLDGTDMDPIELDGCPTCTSFWFDAGELQRISPPENGGSNGGREAKALSMVLEMLFHLPFVIR